MSLTVFNGCLIIAIIAFSLFLILYGDEVKWFLSKIPDFLKNFFMAMSKAWRMSVQGININCEPVDILKVKNKKVRNCRRNYLLNKMKEDEDLIDEDKAKQMELENVKNDDTLEGFKVKNVTDVVTNVVTKHDKKVFYYEPKTNSPLDKVGFNNSDEAEKACMELNSELATKDQLMDAYINDKNTNWCSYGWLKGNNTEICLPLQIGKYDRLTNEQRKIGMCGSYDGAGVNCIRPLKGEQYGAVCYGNNK